MTCPYNLYHDKKSSQQQSGLLNRTYPQDSGHPSDKERENNKIYVYDLDIIEYLCNKIPSTSLLVIVWTDGPPPKWQEILMGCT